MNGSKALLNMKRNAENKFLVVRTILAPHNQFKERRRITPKKAGMRDKMRPFYIVLILCFLIHSVSAEDEEKVKELLVDPIYPFGAESRNAVPEGECAPGLIMGGMGCVDPCEVISCGGHGTCQVQGNIVYCLCDPGFEEVGLVCVGELTSPPAIAEEKPNLTNISFRNTTINTFQNAPSILRSFFSDERINIDIDDVDFHVIIRGGNVGSTGKGNVSDPSIRMNTNISTFSKLNSGEMSLIEALENKSIKSKGNGFFNQMKINFASGFADALGFIGISLEENQQ